MLCMHRCDLFTILISIQEKQVLQVKAFYSMPQRLQDLMMAETEDDNLPMCTVPFYEVVPPPENAEEGELEDEENQ